MTYTKPHPEQGVPYQGRTSGMVSDIKDRKQLQKVIDNRDRNHHMNKEGFGPAELDKISTKPEAIRGREQFLIDKSGGAQSKGGGSSNKINSISDKNLKKPIYESARIKEFGE